MVETETLIGELTNQLAVPYEGEESDPDKNLLKFLRSNSGCIRYTTDPTGHLEDAKLLKEWEKRRAEFLQRWGKLFVVNF